MSFSRPTLKDVAKLSGVSEISVSRVMRNAPNISNRLREKVEAAALALHYTPNKVAGALASNTTDLIGVIIPSLENPTYTQILAGIESVLGQSQYRMMLGVSNKSEKHEIKAVRDLLAWSPTGAIFVGEGYSDESYELLKRSKSTAIEILSNGETAVDIAYDFTYKTALAELVQQWSEDGVKRVAYVESSQNRSSLRDCQSLFRQALSTSGIESSLELIVEKEPSMQLGFELCKQVLKQDPKIDAIFLAGEGFSTSRLMYNTGAGLPSEVALASFSPQSRPKQLASSIDLICLPLEKIGADAAKLFLSGAKQHDSSISKKITLPAEFFRCLR